MIIKNTFSEVLNKPTITVNELKEFLDRVIAHGEGDLVAWTKGDDGYSKVKYVEIENSNKKGTRLILG